MVMYDDPRVPRAIAHPTRDEMLHELARPEGRTASSGFRRNAAGEQA